MRGWSGPPMSRASAMAPAHVPNTGMPCRTVHSQRLQQSRSRRMSLPIVVLSPPGMTRPSTAASWAAVLTSTAPRRTRVAASTAACSANSPWSARTPILIALIVPARTPAASRPEWRRSRRPGIAPPSPRDTRAITSGSRKCVVAWTMAAARRAGSSDLKMPEPTKTPSAPSCIRSAASAGVATSAGGEVHHRQASLAGHLDHKVVGGAQRLRLGGQLLRRGPVQAPDGALHGAHVAHGLHDVARARLALRADHGRPFGDPPQRLAEVAAAADEGNPEGVLVDVVLVVGRREHLRFVDVVDPEGLEHLRLDEVPDAALRHDRDRDRLHDLQDQLGVAHPCHAAGGADVRGHPLQRHDRAGPGILGDTRVLGGDDVHDDAALQHLRQALLREPCRLFRFTASLFRRYDLEWYNKRANYCTDQLGQFSRGGRTMRAENLIVTLEGSAQAERNGPRHRQVFTQVRDAIRDGALRSGDRLPPTRDLALTLGLARNTVARAYDDLLAEGYIEGRVGSGTYVSAGLAELPLRSRGSPRSAVLRSRHSAGHPGGRPADRSSARAPLTGTHFRAVSG